MLKSNLSLSNDEIEEEIVNNDLLNSGSVENEIIINHMSLEEKKDLLRRIEQPTELHNESSSSLLSHSSLDMSTSSFPSLPVAGKNNSEKKLKLPRTQISMLKPTNSEESHTVSLFNLPNCLDDGALPLAMPDRPWRQERTPYYVLKGENPTAALRRMLADHDKWKMAYLRNIQSNDKDVQEFSSSKVQRHASKEESDEDDENDPYTFEPKPQVIKTYSSLRKRETNNSPNETLNSRKPRTVQRKASRDSDCEEVETILKPSETNMGEWIQASSQKSKRNRKRLNNQDKGRSKSVDEGPDVEFGFDNKWEHQSSSWQGSQSPSVRTSLPEVQEETVECPICQKRFPQSKVENHAATCEGFSDSPMEIEEN